MEQVTQYSLSAILYSPREVPLWTRECGLRCYRFLDGLKSVLRAHPLPTAAHPLTVVGCGQFQRDRVSFQVD